MTDRPRVYLAIPMYDSWLHRGVLSGILTATSKNYIPPDFYHKQPILVRDHSDSMLGNCFNRLWAEALEYRDRGEITHFAMLHTDIAPVVFWLDILVDECERLGADVVSAISPLKSAHGLTSCGIGDHKDRINPLFRFTLKELEEGILAKNHPGIYGGLDIQTPDTFSSADTGYPKHPLTVNTGCWIADLRKDWCSATEYYDPPQGSSNYPQQRLKVSFNCISHIYAPAVEKKEVSFGEPWEPENRPHPNNRTGEKYYVDHDSEDWRFSWMLWDWKCKVYATKKVFLDHVGEMRYPNRGKWGTLDHDEPLAYKEKR
jgi:hypothetical protein